MKRFKFILPFYLMIISFVFINSSHSYRAWPTGGGWTGHFTIYGAYKTSSGGRTIYGQGKINVYLPKSYLKGYKRLPLLIGLPGWRAKADEWRTRAKIGRYAEKYNFIVALVEVYTTAYETAYYRETNPRYKWGSIPGTVWIGNVVMPYLKKHFRIDLSGKRTGIFGLSTGGRGAVFLCQKYPKYFKACVSMSGDFDRVSLYEWCKKRRKNIMRHDPPSVTIYGHPARNKKIMERWKNVDNPSSDKNVNILKKYGISVYLIHGKRDFAVPYEQSQDFYNKLKNAGVDVKGLFLPRAGHNWYLWREYVPLMFQYFSSKLK